MGSTAKAMGLLKVAWVTIPSREPGEPVPATLSDIGFVFDAIETFLITLFPESAI